MEIVNCLNLEKRPDRLLEVAKQAKAQGFALKIWNGIEAETRRDARRCICQSHKIIIQYAKDNNLPFINICEDDIEFFAEGAFDYWIENTPKDYDLYFGLVYSGEVNEENRVINGMSGVLTLYRVHSRFYDFILNEIPDDSHLDRELGNTAFKNKYFVSPQMVCQQRGGFSDHLKRNMTYEPYLEGKEIYGR